MEIVRCSNGHFYDSETNHSCPRCEQEKRGMSGRSTGYLGTEDFMKKNSSDGSILHTEFFDTNDDSHTGWQKTTDSDSDVKQKYPKTTFSRDVGEIGKTISVRDEFNEKDIKKPKKVVGWLVCIQGPTKGKDYRIVDQNNFIGRNPNMDIAIPEDSSISGDRSAVIAYDFRSRNFFFGLASGHNMVSINDRIVFNPEIIKAYDVLGIGNSKFIFIPLCGEQFEWDEL